MHQFQGWWIQENCCRWYRFFKKKITSLQKRDKLRQDMHKATIYHKHPLLIVEEGERVDECFLFLFLSRKLEKHFLNFLIFLLLHNLSPFSQWTLMSQGAVFYRVRSAPAHTSCRKGWIKRLSSFCARPLAPLPKISRNPARSKWEEESLSVFQIAQSQFCLLYLLSFLEMGSPSVGLASLELTV